MSAPIGMILPTANQVSDVLKALEEGYGDTEVLEILIRKYKTVAERVRPNDRMIAHTGYLVFTRKLETLEGES
jgi:tRNA (adenine57-N1/adenine58-N1)-methyltransferase catalytic subunit